MKSGENTGDKLTDRDSKSGDDLLRRLLKSPPKKHAKEDRHRFKSKAVREEGRGTDKKKD